MLAGFSALNERSDAFSDHDSSDNGSSSESVDFRDEDYLELYNRALQNFGEEAYERAENEFRHLVSSPYFAQCGFNGGPFGVFQSHDFEKFWRTRSSDF